MPSKSGAFLVACNLVCRMCLMFSRLLTDLVWLAFGLGSVCIACQNASYKLWLEFVSLWI